LDGSAFYPDFFEFERAAGPRVLTWSVGRSGTYGVSLGSRKDARKDPCMDSLVPFYGDHDESHVVTQTDLERIASLPVEESLRLYITLRSFNKEHPAFMNVRVQGSKMSTIVSDDGSRVQPEFTARCANVVLDWYVTRLKDFARVNKSQWNADVAKMIAEVPTGITQWDNKKRTKFTRMVADILRFLTDAQRHNEEMDEIDRRKAQRARLSLEYFLESPAVEIKEDATCPYADFVDALKKYTRDRLPTQDDINKALAIRNLKVVDATLVGARLLNPFRDSPGEY
jgi:hypothetical protein